VPDANYGEPLPASRAQLSRLQLADIGGWPAVLGQLAAGADLSSAVAAAALREILEGAASPSQMAAFIFGLRCKGETSDELAGMLDAMLEVAETVPVPSEIAERLVDTCGTGGDGAGTINISTAAALVVAGAGAPVCKHGGRAASSRTGSADVLEALGVEIALPPASVARCIEEAGIGFCFAPRYHPAMRHVVPTRRELGVPTAFNLLGPLANPARARYQLVGVGDGRVAERLAGVLASAGAHRAWVVHGEDGLDELSTVAPSRVVEYWAAGTGSGAGGSGAGGSGAGGSGAGGSGAGGSGAGGSGAGGRGLRSFLVDPATLGLAPARPGDLKGGDAADNAEAVGSVLSGEKGPHRDIVLLNAAAALLLVGDAGDLHEGLALAGESVDSGRARQCLERLVSLSRSEAARLA